MELNKSLSFKIYDLRCEFRTLNEKDVNQDYLNGLDEQNKYIKNIPAKISFASQKKYVRETLDTKSDTLLGLIVNNNLVATAGVQLSFSEIFPLCNSPSLRKWQLCEPILRWNCSVRKLVLGTRTPQ